MTVETKKGGSYVFSGIIGLVISGGAALFARDFPIQGIQEGLGAAFFPYLVIGVIAILGLGQTIYGLAVGFEIKSPFASDADLRSVASLFVCFILYAFAFAQFGLIFPTIAFLIIAMILLKAHWKFAVAVGAVSGFAIYALFVLGFGIPMPS